MAVFMLRVSVYMCVCVCVFVCVLSADEEVPAQRIRHRDYTIWTTYQGTEYRVTTFSSETYNISSVPKSQTVSLGKSSHGA